MEMESGLEYLWGGRDSVEFRGEAFSLNPNERRLECR